MQDSACAQIFFQACYGHGHRCQVLLQLHSDMKYGQVLLRALSGNDGNSYGGPGLGFRLQGSGTRPQTCNRLCSSGTKIWNETVSRSALLEEAFAAVN